MILPKRRVKYDIREISCLNKKGVNRNPPIPVCILIRKLYENLIIDIFRKQYGMEDISIFFDKKQRRFNNFSLLLKTLSEKEADFRHISSDINNLISKINRFRENGNAAAHSIDIDITIDQIESMKADINYLAKQLISIRQKL
jgi:hypothetical protein